MHHHHHHSHVLQLDIQGTRGEGLDQVLNGLVKLR